MSNRVRHYVILTDENGDPISSGNPLPIGAEIAVGDIEIGAVEIKNDSDDTRAKVGAGTAANALRGVEASDSPVTTVLGATADAVVAAGAAGSLSAKLRAISRDLVANIVLAAGENHLGAVGGHVARISVNFTRPSDTNVYASGDLVANNTVANSVTPMQFALSRAAGKGGMIRRLRMRKTGTSITNASFRLHLYSASPVQAGGAGAGTGDNAVWSTDQAGTYVGSMDVTCDRAFTDGASGNGVPNTGSEIVFTADTYYGLLEARGAYVPANAEAITLMLEVIQN